MTNQRVRVYQLLVTLLIALNGWTMFQLGPTSAAKGFGALVLWGGVSGVFTLVIMIVGSWRVARLEDPG